MMELSIIIVSYNTKRLTLDAIKSVFADTSVKSKEVIVVDNGSRDNSVDAILKFKVQNPILQLKIIQNAENLGFSKANNQGIKASQGKYILLLNSDTKVKKGALGKLIKFADQNRDAGVVGAKLLNADGSVQKSCNNFPTIGRAIKQYWLRRGKPLDKFVPHDTGSINNDSAHEVDAVVGAAMLITPKALLRFGGLDERYFFFYEDLDYCRQVKTSGMKVYYLPSAEVVHYHGASGKGLRKKDDQWRRLVPGSKIYHGLFRHYIFNFILWSGQKWQKLTRN